MNSSKSKLATLLAESVELDGIHKHFFEADKLDLEAYEILNDKPLTLSSMRRFSKAKSAASAKYEKAHQLWDAYKGHNQRRN